MNALKLVLNLLRLRVWNFSLLRRITRQSPALQDCLFSVILILSDSISEFIFCQTRSFPGSRLAVRWLGVFVGLSGLIAVCGTGRAQGSTIPNERRNPTIREGEFKVDYGLEDDLGLVDWGDGSQKPSYPMWYCKNGNLLDSQVLPLPTLFSTQPKITFRFYSALAPATEASALFVVGPDGRIFREIQDSEIDRNDDMAEIEIHFPSVSNAFGMIYGLSLPEEARTYYLFRTLDFRRELFDSKGDKTVDSSSEKLVILIHGWNPPKFFGAKVPDPYYNGPWRELSDALESKLPLDWGLIKYDWAKDAATGDRGFGLNTGPDRAVRLFEGLLSGVEAAEIGHSHGRHLGEVLHDRAPNLVKVHFIAHSAGSWIARTAAAYILKYLPETQVQVTFLDPFMPIEADFRASALGAEIMNQLVRNENGVSWTSDRVFLAENYYSDIDAIPFFHLTGLLGFDGTIGTQERFSWRSQDVNERVSLGSVFPDPRQHYGGHSGPIEFYSHSVTHGIAASYRTRLKEKGWPLSLAYQELNTMAKPRFTPDSKSASAPFEVAISVFDLFKSDIRFTRDGSIPTKDSEIYTGPVLIEGTTTLTARTFFGATPDIFNPNPSEPVSATYTILPASMLAAPAIFPESGTYESPRSVKISASPSDATIRYTTDGSEPSLSSSLIWPNGSVKNFAGSVTIKAKAFKDGFDPSPLATAVYTVVGTGTEPKITRVNNDSVVTGAPSRQWFTIHGSGFMRGFVATFRDETYEENWPTITDPDRLRFDNAGQVAVFAGVGTDASVWSVRITNPNGTSSEKRYFAVVNPTGPPPVAAPTLSHASGPYESSISVTMNTATDGAVIRYTTTGFDPTEQSELYVQPVSVSGPMRLKARAFKYGSPSSSVTVADYSISAPVEGGLRVLLDPPGARDAAARWRVHGRDWLRSGETASGLPVGNAVIDFRPVDGWIRPLVSLATVAQGEPPTLSYSYRLANRLPVEPSAPFPAHGAVKITRSQPILQWTGGDPDGGPVDYALRFGSENNPGFRYGFGDRGFSGSSFQLPEGLLQGGTTYYWGVRSRDAEGEIRDGPIWKFTTEHANADLVALNPSVEGVIKPGAEVQISVTVRNEGTFASPGAYVRFYLSSAAGSKEVQLTPNVPDIVPSLAPGAERRVTFTAKLDRLQAGTSYIDAWIDSGPPGPYNEINFDNNLRSAELAYDDTVPPEVTQVRMLYPSLRTGHDNAIVYFTEDDIGLARVDIHYSVDGGTSWEPIREGHIPESTHGETIQWRIPNDLTATDAFKVRAIAWDSSGNQSEGQSIVYALRDGTAPTVEVVSPNGGEVLDMGATHKLRWNISAPNGVREVSLYIQSGSLNSVSVLARFAYSDPGEYVWSVPSSVSGMSTTTARIRVHVVDENLNEAEDLSDGVFSIRDTSAPPPAPWNSVEIVPGGMGTPKLKIDSAENLHMISYAQERVGSDPLLITQTIRYQRRVGDNWSSPAIVYSKQDESDQSASGVRFISEYQLALDSQNRPHVVWQESQTASLANDSDILYSTFDGIGWSSPRNLSSNVRSDSVPTHSKSPRITVDSSDRVHVVWEDGTYFRQEGSSFVTTEGDQYIYHRNRISGQWSDSLRASLEKGRVPALDFDSTGGIHLAYLRGLEGIRYRRWENDSWLESEEIVTRRQIFNPYLRLRSGSDGSRHIVWQEFNQGDAIEELFHCVSANGEAWSEPEIFVKSATATVPSMNLHLLQPHILFSRTSPRWALFYTSETGAESPEWTPPVQIHRDTEGPSDVFSFDSTLSAKDDVLHVVWSSWKDGNQVIRYNSANVGTSEDVFAPSVSVLSPASGDVLSIGVEYPIEWTASDNDSVTEVDIQLMRGGEILEPAIALARAADGRYLWRATGPEGESLQIRVAAKDPAGNSGIGFSGSFRLADLTPPDVTIQPPTPEELIVAGGSREIRWNATDNVAVERVDLSYSLDGGNRWLELITEVPNTGSYEWNVPNQTTEMLRIRVTARDAAELTTTAVTPLLTIVRANTPPHNPHSPFPLPASDDVPINAAVLQWSSGDLDGDELTYQVRLGRDAEPPVVSTSTASSFQAGALEFGATYQWQVEVSDGKGTVTGPVWSFTTEQQPLEPPSISAISDQTTDEDEPLNGIAFTIGDAETPVSELRLTMLSSDSVLVPPEDIQIVGTGATRTLTITPGNNLSGFANITIRVEDADGMTAEESFVLTVNPVNDAPRVSAVADQIVLSGERTPEITFAVTDEESTGSELDVTAFSSKEALVMSSAIELNGEGSQRTVRVASIPGKSGSATITLRVTDEQGLSTESSFAVTVQEKQMTLTGTVWYYAGNRTIPGVQAVLGSGTMAEALTGADGSFGFEVAPGGTYSIEPGKADDNSPAHGVTTLDITLIRRHILGIAALDSPYKLIAADVNGSSSVTTLDITLIRRVILGISESFPGGFWKFVASDYEFGNPAAPWGYPSSRSFPGVLSDEIGQDFIGVKLGDVNGSWSPPSAIQSSARFGAETGIRKDTIPPTVQLEIAAVTARQGERIEVPVRALTFNGVTSLQMTLEWNPRVLEFHGANAGLLRSLSEDNFGIQASHAGRLTLSWDDPEGTGVTLEPGTTAFSLAFRSLLALEHASIIRLTGGPVPREASVGEIPALLSVRTSGATSAQSEPPRPIVSIKNGSSAIWIEFGTVSGWKYSVQSTDSIAGGIWHEVGTLEGTGRSEVLRDHPAGDQDRFYRVVISH